MGDRAVGAVVIDEDRRVVLLVVVPRELTLLPVGLQCVEASLASQPLLGRPVRDVALAKNRLRCMQVFLYPPVVLPKKVRPLGREVGPGRLVGGARSRDEEGQSDRSRGHAPWVRRVGPIRHPILILSLLFAPLTAFSQGLPTGPEEPLRLLRDGETPGWGLEGQARSAFLQALDRGEFQPGVVEALPRRLLEQADWKDRIGVPEDVVEVDGVGYFADARYLWRTDGTRLGTYHVAALPSDRTVPESPRRLFRLQGALYVFAHNDDDEALLLRLEERELRVLGRWRGSRGPSGLSIAGGFAWFGLGSVEGDRLYRLDAEGEVVAVRDLREEAPASIAPGTLFQGVFEVGPHLVAVEWAFAAQIREPASQTPEFWRLSPPNVRMIQDLRRAAFDSSLWFVGRLSGLEELYRTDGTPEGTERLLVERTIAWDYLPLRHDRFAVGDVLYDGDVEVIGEFLRPVFASAVPKAGGLFAVRRRDADSPAGPPVAHEALFFDVETGTVTVVAERASEERAARWIDTGSSLFLESFDAEGRPSFERWSEGGLEPPIELRVRGQKDFDGRLSGLVCERGLTAGSGATGAIEWIDRETGARRLRATGNFFGVSGEVLVIAADAQPFGVAAFRFDPDRAAEPELVLSSSGRGGAVGLVERHLVLRLSDQVRGSRVLAIDVDDGSESLVPTSEEASGAFFNIVQPAPRGLLLLGNDEEGQLRVARWRPSDGDLSISPISFPSLPRLVSVDDALWAVQIDQERRRLYARFYPRILEGGSFASPLLVVLDGGYEDDAPVFESVVRGRRALVRAGRTVVFLTEGTVQVVEGLPPELDFSATRLTERGAYLVADDLVHGRELYRLDDLSQGSAPQLVDIVPGPAGSNPSSFTPAFGGHIFLADDGVHGRELWFDDGREVRMVCDLVPGPLSGAEPYGLLADEEGVYLRADTGERGRALWRVAKEVVLGETPCPSLQLLTPEFGPEPEAMPPAGEALAAGEGGCRQATPSLGLWACLLLGALRLRSRARTEARFR